LLDSEKLCDTKPLFLVKSQNPHFTKLQKLGRNFFVLFLGTANGLFKPEEMMFSAISSSAQILIEHTMLTCPIKAGIFFHFEKNETA
jgi:hypothetical protein